MLNSGVENCTKCGQYLGKNGARKIITYIQKFHSFKGFSPRVYSLQHFVRCAPASCLPLTSDVGWMTELSPTSGPSLFTQLVVSAAVARLATGNPPPPCHGKPAQAPLSLLARLPAASNRPGPERCRQFSVLSISA